MDTLVIIGFFLTLIAIVVNIIMIVMGFKHSVRHGIVSLLSPLLLCGALTIGYIKAHQYAISEMGAEEVRKQGDKEAQSQIDELDEVENIDLGL